MMKTNREQIVYRSVLFIFMLLKNVTQEMGMPIEVLFQSRKVESCVKTGICKNHILIIGLQKSMLLATFIIIYLFIIFIIHYSSENGH